MELAVTMVGTQMLDLIVQMIRQKLLERADQDWQDFIEEDGFIRIDEDAVLNTAFDDVIGSRIEDPRGYEYMYLSVNEHPSLEGVFDEMRELAKEAADDAREWERAKMSPEAMLRYHGLSIHNFM
jgi:hypothetical protein